MSRTEMGPLKVTIESCHRHYYLVLKIEVLVIFIPSVTVYKTGLQAITEGPQYTVVLLLVVTPTL